MQQRYVIEQASLLYVLLRRQLEVRRSSWRFPYTDGSMRSLRSLRWIAARARES